ncbi:TonB-dependent receptor [Flavobacterium sp. HXWNR69]|uniref:TonB-dependent receptor n=1 Tax=Flavobacterium fragile TaxID=2949085 RepID=A0ABT0THT5_9FLAO|nr:TonB-dependent receptor [Flavobacterium sp. HXWNR69]MCL9770528.1 TonB-dependent receptor [Flavobacterium sp. HXWNR69]
MKQIYLLCLIFFSSFIIAQNNFVGKIIDEKTKNPIENVTIYFPNLNKTVTTNSEGNFSLNTSQKNKQLIEIYSLNYESKVLTIEVEAFLNIELTEKILELEEIILTGNLNANKEKIPFAIETVKNEDLFKSGKISLAENLSTITGVSFSSSGIAATKPVIRGLTNTNIVFLNNGIKAENFQFSSNHPFISDEFSARKIEVIKGPFSLIYGSDAVGGVINVIPENPATEKTIAANLNSQYHSNTEGYVNNLNLKASGKKWFGGIHITNKTHKDYKDGNENQIINSRFSEINVGTNLGYRNSFGNFIFTYDYALPKYGLTNQKSISFVNNNHRIPRDWFQKLENQSFTLKNKLYIKGNILDVDFGFQKNIRQGISDLTNLNPEMLFSEMDLKTFSYNTKYTITKDKYKLILGFNGANIDNNANDFYKNSNPMPDAKINDFGIFAVNDFLISKNLNLYTGIRYDNRTMESSPFQSSGLNKYKVNNNYNSFSGSIGTTYKIKNHLFKINIASGFRTPNISELSQNGIHQNRFERGDLNLDAQRNYQFDFNYHYHLKNIVFDFTPFYNNVNNYIYIVQTTENAPIGGGKIWQYVQNDANLYGMEFSLDYHPLNWLGIHSNYTWTKGELKNGGFLTQIPQNRWVAELKFEKEKLGILYRPNFSINYTNFQHQNNLGQLETYAQTYNLVGLNMGSEIVINNQKINWYLAVNNLFNETYIDHLSALKPLNINNLGRNIVVGLNIPFENKL